MLVLHSHRSAHVSCSAVRAVRTIISREEDQLGEQRPFHSSTCPRPSVLRPRAVLCLACCCAAGRCHNSLGSGLVPLHWWSCPPSPASKRADGSIALLTPRQRQPESLTASRDGLPLSAAGWKHSPSTAGTGVCAGGTGLTFSEWGGGMSR